MTAAALAADPGPVPRVLAAMAAQRRARRTATAGYGLVFLACLLVSAWMSEVRPETLAAGLPRIGEYFWLILPTLSAEHLFAGPKTEGSLAFWMYRLDAWAWLMFETSQMAALATLMGGAAAFLLCFPASRTLMRGAPVASMAVRRALEVLRSVPDLVYALILVWAFGVGPLAGILAIALHSTGALGKLFAEAVENADLRPLDGVRASGGGWLHGVRFAIVPQVLPNVLSYALLRFEINLRGASVIGFVGAGGIGQELYTVISFNYYEEVSAIVVLIILSVCAIDLAAERLRQSLIGAER